MATGYRPVADARQEALAQQVQVGRAIGDVVLRLEEKGLGRLAGLAREMGLDIGPKSVEAFKKEIRKAKTVVWNGPMGVFEKPAFSAGTFAVAEAIAAAKCVSIIGGGDSVSAVNKSGVADKMTHISTGGGASLELLEGKALPGVVALNDA